MIADLTERRERPHRFAIYNLSPRSRRPRARWRRRCPNASRTAHGWDVATVMRCSFLIYVVTAVAGRARVPRAAHARGISAAPRRGLHKSREHRHPALGAVHARRGGRRLRRDVAARALPRPAVRSLAGGDRRDVRGGRDVLTAFSQFLSPRLAARIGLVRTMVFTHLPANVFLILAGIVPNAAAAIAFLLLPRRAVADGRAGAPGAGDARRRSPTNGAAAASVTNVPRSLGARRPRRRSPA